MRDLIFTVFFLCTCTGFGLLFVRYLPADCFKARALAAPTFGLAIISVGITLGYRYGLAPWKFVALVAFAASGALIVQCVAVYKRGAQWLVSTGSVTVTIVVLLLCLAPKWTGGAQFASFQGNHYDQINYLSFAATARKYSYQDLVSFDAVAKQKANFYSLVSENPDDRWAVSIIYSGFAELIGFYTVEASYAYMAALQIIFFLSASFLIVQLTNDLSWRVWLCASAAATGFPIQYVIDINAWSELAALPIVLVAFTCLLKQIERGTTSPASTAYQTRIVVTSGLLFGSLFYLYPEITPIYLIGMCASTVFMALIETRRDKIRIAVTSIAAAATGLLLCLPYLQGTLRFLFQQLSSALRARPDWWTYFQKYLFDASSQGLIGTDTSQHLDLLGIVVRTVEVPADIILAGLGLYFVLPTGLSVLKAAWMFCDVIFLLGLLLAAVLTWAGAWISNRRSQQILFLISSLAMLAAAVGVGISGRYWVAGKALSMIQPLLFICVTAPFWLRSRSLAVQMPSLAMVGLYLAFGLARPIEAANPSGIHYPPPYPSIQDPELKKRYQWDFSRYSKTIRQCKVIALDVDNVVLERYAQVFLIGFNIPWYSTHAIEPNWGSGPNLGMQEPMIDPDCVLTSKRLASYGRAKVLPLWSN